MANRNYGDRSYEERNRDWGSSGQGVGRQGGREGDYSRDIDWRSGQGDSGSGSWGQGQGRFGQSGQGGSANQASQYGYSSGGGYAGQQWQQGPHTGRGPQGYQRSNESIQEEVCEILTRHGHVDASGITVEVSNGEVTLSGTVNSRQEKRMAEECLENLSGVRDIHNQLRVAGRAGNGGSQDDLGSEASGVQPSQSARGSSAASGASAAAGTQGAGETTRSRRRT